MTSDNISVVKFEAAPKPTAVEVKGQDYYSWGEDNYYPQYLLDCLDESGKHGAIVTGKVHFVVGRGFVLDEGIDPETESKITTLLSGINENDSADDLLYKHASDLEVFGAFAVEVIPRKDKKGWATLNHIGIEKLRWNKDKTRIFYSECWAKKGETYYKPKEDEIKEKKLFNPKTFSGIYIFTQYRPGQAVYPKPEYIGCMKYISIDIQIATFHDSNLANGFAAGTMISFNNGTPTQEEQKLIDKKVKSKFNGVDNAGQTVIVFSDGKDSAPTIVPLQSNNFDKLFDTLNARSEQEIFTGHKVTSPMLFGIKTEGQLGGATELQEAWELLKNGYVNAKQRMILGVYNWLFSLNGLGKPLSIEDIEPIGFTLTESGLLQVLTKDEIRARMGEAPSEKPANEKTQKTLNALNSLSPLVATKVLETMTEDEIRALAELPPAVPGTLPTQMGKQLTDDEKIELFASRGIEKSKFKIHFSEDVEDKDDSLKKEMAFYRQHFEKDDLLNPPSLSNAPAVSVKVMWSYELRASAPDLVPGGTSRPFCKKMVSLDRLYNRADIDFISSKLGYDVWKMRGGFYHNPKLDITTDYCRHVWKQNIVSNG